MQNFSKTTQGRRNRKLFCLQNHIGNFNQLLNGEFTVYELIALKGNTQYNNESKNINISYIEWLGCNQEKMH